jgi:hypothetical protein
MCPIRMMWHNTRFVPPLIPKGAIEKHKKFKRDLPHRLYKKRTLALAEAVINDLG